MTCSCSHDGREHTRYTGESEMAACSICVCRSYSPVVSLDGIIVIVALLGLTVLSGLLLWAIMRAYH